MSTETETKLSTEMQQLKQDFGKFKSELGEVIRIAGAEGKQKIKAAYETATDYGKDALETSRRTINERPLTFMLAAFVAGVLVTKIWDRK